MNNLIKKILREQVSETEIESDFEDFYKLFKEKYGNTPNYEDIFEEIEKDIKKSPTPKITITDRGMFCGMSLTNNVILSKSIFSRDIFGFIFVVFHEIAHQYQYKKYGKNLLYELTTKEITDATLNKLMDIEQVADRFGKNMASKYASKFNLQKKPISSPYDNIEYGKSSYKRLIESIQKKIKDGEITCVEQMESFLIKHLISPPSTPSTYSYTGSSYSPSYSYGGSKYSTYDDYDYEREYNAYNQSRNSDDLIDTKILDEFEVTLNNLKYDINNELNEIIDDVENLYGENGANIIRGILNEEGFEQFYYDNSYIQTDEEVDDIDELAFNVDEDFYGVIRDLKKYIEDKLHEIIDEVEKTYGFEGVTAMTELIDELGFDNLFIKY